MKKFNILFLFILFGVNSNFILATGLNVGSDIGSKRAAENVVKDKFDLTKKLKNTDLKNIDFSFKDFDLIDVINIVAAAKGENVILPTGADAIKSKITIETPEKVAPEEAWDLLNTVLDVAGYVVSTSAGGMSKIVKKDDNLVKNPFRIFKEEQDQARIFVDTDYKEIPDTDERIIFLGYFENIQVPRGDQAGGGDDSQNIIQQVIQIYTGDRVNSRSDRGTSSFRFIPEANGVIIIDKSSSIRSMMKIFSQLDKAGFKEHIEKIKLENVSANKVADMFNNENTGIIGKKAKTTYRLGKKRKSKSKYFDKETKVIAEEKSNSLFLLGNKDAIDKIKEFIFRFIDIPIEGGRSILHRKKLDYLDCDRLKSVLEQIVKQAPEDGSQARAGAAGAGPERFFQEVRIETDRPKASDGGGDASKAGQYKYSGTNSLLIAANNEDWMKINELVEKLDKPLRQVIIEILIVDLTMDGNKVLGSQTRNPALAPLFNISHDGRPINVQSAQLAGQVTTKCASEPCLDVPKTLKADLMQGTQGTDPTAENYNPFIRPTAGSSLLTLSDKDGHTWSVLKVLDLYQNTKILSHPYIVAVNNKPAVVKVGLQKILQGDAQDTSGGAIRVLKTKVDADITVNVTPRIGGIDAQGNASVNLQVGIEINEFASTIVVQDGLNPMIKRNISTNANIKNGEILALGGLIKVESTNGEGKTPILGSIPVIGWFFKSKNKNLKRTTLTIFIRATAVEPEVNGKMDAYTRDYINTAKKCSEEGGLFEGLRDPVTRWFFGSENPAGDRIDDFMAINKKIISTEELKFAELKVCVEKSTVVANSDLPKNFAQGNLNSSTSKVNSAGQDLASAQVKNNQNASSQNSYELFEDGKQADLLANSGACPVIIDPAMQATEFMNNNIMPADNVNVILAQNKEPKNCKRNLQNCSQNNDKLRDLLSGMDSPFTS